MHVTWVSDCCKLSGALKARVVKADTQPGKLNQQVRFAGWLITVKVVHTKKGDPMEFLTFEDETGMVETTFFPNAYNRFCHLLNYGHPYLLKGVVEQNWGAATLTVKGQQQPWDEHLLMLI